MQQRLCCSPPSINAGQTVSSVSGTAGDTPPYSILRQVNSVGFFHAKYDFYSLKQPDGRISQDGVHDLAIMFGLRIISALAVAVMTAVNSRLDSTSETHGGIAHHHQCHKVTTLQIFFVVVVKLGLKTLNRHLAHTHKKNITQKNCASASGSANQPLLPVLDENALDAGTGGDKEPESMDGDDLLRVEEKALVRRKRLLRNKVRVRIRVRVR